MDVLLEETQGKKVFVVAGEVSGDALAAHVLRHHTCIEGVIGQNLKDIGAKEFLPIDVFQTLGFFSVLHGEYEDDGGEGDRQGRKGGQRGKGSFFH